MKKGDCALYIEVGEASNGSGESHVEHAVVNMLSRACFLSSVPSSCSIAYLRYRDSGCGAVRCALLTYYWPASMLRLPHFVAARRWWRFGDHARLPA